MTKNTGGPAFPTEPNTQPGIYANHGITLRDYFAGQALELLVRVEENRAPFRDITDAARANRAYALADAMLAARDLP